MRWRSLLLLTAALAACHDGSEPGSAPTAAADTLRVVGGPLECDSCPSTRFTIVGPAVGDIASAAFVPHDRPDGDPLDASIELRRVTGDSGVSLEAKATFTGAVDIGLYDLRLATPQRNPPLQRLLIGGVLRVTRGWKPSAPPDTTTPPPPAPPPPPPPPAPPTTTGTLRVTVTATGDDVDQEFGAIVDEDYGGPYLDVKPPAAAEFVLRSGPHFVSLYNVASNCEASGGTVRQVTVRADTTVTVDFAITCSRLAYIRADLVLDGVSPFGDPRNPYLAMQCDGLVVCALFTESVRSLLQATNPGPHTWSVRTPSYCRVAGGLPVAVSATAGDTAHVEFRMTCDPFEGALTVRLRTTGAGLASAFGVLYGDDSCAPAPYADGCAWAPIGGSGTVTVPVLAGPVVAGLGGGSANCRLLSPSPVRVQVAGGGTAEVAFDVECE